MDDLKTARGLRIEVRFCEHTWLEILVSKEHWSILESEDIETCGRNVFTRISNYLDGNTWETPWAVVEWLKSWVEVGNIGRWDGKEEDDDQNS